MKIPPSLIKECEDLIAQGDLDLALAKLLTVKDKTSYKNDILTLNSRWNKLTRNQLNGTLSSEDFSRQNNQLNSNFLLLLEALRKELDGEKANSNLFKPEAAAKAPWHPLTQTYLPIFLTALAVWGISYFAFQSPVEECHQKVNLSGDWDVHYDFNKNSDRMGYAKITQETCMASFQMSGALKSATSPNNEVDFSAEIGGFDDGIILFVYENFAGERGVCRGIVPEDESEIFTVHCVDLIGFDKDNSSTGSLTFKKTK